MRDYFITPKELAAIIGFEPETIRDWCAEGRYHAIKVGRRWKIPTVEIRKEHRDMSIEFWNEIVEDLYRNLNGYDSAKMRLERRKHGKDPSTGELIKK